MSTKSVYPTELPDINLIRLQRDEAYRKAVQTILASKCVIEYFDANETSDDLIGSEVFEVMYWVAKHDSPICKLYTWIIDKYEKANDPVYEMEDWLQAFKSFYIKEA